MGLDPEFIGNGTGHKVWFTGKCKNPAGTVLLRYCFSVVSGKIGTLVTKLFSMRIIAPLFFFGLLCSYSATAQRELSAEEEAFFSRAMSQINAKHVRWINSTAKEANEKNLSPDEVMSRSNAYRNMGSLKDQETEAISSLAMILMSKDKKENLKIIMTRLKALKEQKEKIMAAISALDDKNRSVTRPQLDSFKLLLITRPSDQRKNTVPSSRAVTPIEMNETRTRLSEQRDSLSELEEEQQLRMQMMMERYQKIMETLSNLMKKIAGMQDAIISNLK